MNFPIEKKDAMPILHPAGTIYLSVFWEGLHKQFSMQMEKGSPSSQAEEWSRDIRVRMVDQFLPSLLFLLSCVHCLSRPDTE